MFILMTRFSCLMLLSVTASCAGTANHDLWRTRDVIVTTELDVPSAGSTLRKNSGRASFAPLPASQEPRELDARYADLGIRRPKPSVYLQGYIGANFIDSVSRQGGFLPRLEGHFDQGPVIGGGGQWVMGGGERLDLGLEGMINFGGRANALAFRVGGGGAAVAVDLDMLAIDLYGGPFASTFLGEKVRVYGSIGPMLQFVSYDENPTSAPFVGGSGSGFGTGLYARTGAEIRARPGTLVGLGVRASEGLHEVPPD